MEILVKDHREHGLHAVLLFGVGMIGTAIRDSLHQKEYRVGNEVHMDWKDAEKRSRAVEEIRGICAPLAPARLSISWSAGNTNFFSTQQETADEDRAFDAVLGLGTTLVQALHHSKLDFHFLSSAGGLFEGQRIVNETSRAAPRRPYGRMKHDQERRILASAASLGTAIYRPSSVYGPMVRPRRHGLVNHLIANASNRRTTVLDANVMALRDYVYSGDVGEYIAREIAFPRRQDQNAPVHFLVSGRCASIYEVVSRIERVLKTKVRYRFDANFGNSADITFSDSVLPRGWRPSTLDVGIRQFVLKDQPQTRAIESVDRPVH